MERYMMILKSIKRMNPELEESLRNNVTPLTLKKHQLLQSHEGLNNNIYFIEKGLLHYFIPKNDVKISFEFRYEDQFVNSLRDYGVPEDISGIAIEAIEETLLWCFPGDIVDQLLKKHFRFSIQYREIILRDHFATRNAMLCSIPNKGTINFENLCIWLPKLLHRVPIPYLANLTQLPEKHFFTYSNPHHSFSRSNSSWNDFNLSKTNLTSKSSFA